MKKLLLAFLLLFAYTAQAQIVPSIPYTLTNGSLADATQVMGNFNTIVTDVNANAATNGANTNITSLTGLTTPLSNTYGGTVIYTGGTTGGSANAQTLATTTPSNFSLTTGNIVTGVAGATNTTATTLAVDGGAATQTAVQTPLGLISTPAKTLVTGQGFVAFFDGTYFELIGGPPNSVANSQLALMSNNTVKANISGGNAVPSDITFGTLASNANYPVRVQRQTITGTGTYTPCTGLIYGDYELWAGGGGGGGTAAASGAAGAGGGAGGYVRKIINAATIASAAPITVTIGGAGSAGSSAGGNGGQGGTSSMGTLISATGGLGGTGSNSADTAVAGGSGGTGTSGDINMTGAPGAQGISPNQAVASSSGNGGSTSLGGAGKSIVGNTNTAGNNATANSGSGGSGAGSAGTGEVGGTGGTGFFAATEFCNQ